MPTIGGVHGERFNPRLRPVAPQQCGVRLLYVRFSHLGKRSAEVAAASGF